MCSCYPSHLKYCAVHAVRERLMRGNKLQSGTQCTENGTTAVGTYRLRDQITDFTTGTSERGTGDTIANI